MTDLLLAYKMSKKEQYIEVKRIKTNLLTTCQTSQRLPAASVHQIYEDRGKNCLYSDRQPRLSHIIPSGSGQPGSFLVVYKEGPRYC